MQAIYIKKEDSKYLIYVKKIFKSLDCSQVFLNVKLSPIYINNF